MPARAIRPFRTSPGLVRKTGWTGTRTSAGRLVIEIVCVIWYNREHYRTRQRLEDKC